MAWKKYTGEGTGKKDFSRGVQGRASNERIEFTEEEGWQL